MKIGSKVIFNKNATEFGIGKKMDIGTVVRIRHSKKYSIFNNKSKILTVIFENGKIFEINSTWLKVSG